MAAYLVSDREREHTVGLLRDHWLTGRLTAEEFEQRIEEAWRARFPGDLWQALRFLPPEAPVARVGSGRAVAALFLGIAALLLFLTSFSLAAPLCFPMFAAAWALGRGARRRRVPARGVAVTAEVIGVLGTIVCAWWMAAVIAAILQLAL